MEKVAEVISDLITNGIDLLRDYAGVDITAVTFLMQLAATIILFLVVRFFFWNKVTNFLAARREAIQKSLDEKAAAEVEAERIKNENAILIENAHQEAQAIIEEAKKQKMIETDLIMSEAQAKIANDERESRERLELERQKIVQNLKNEIVDVAFLMAEKVTNSQIDVKKNQQLVDDFLQEVGK